MISTDGAHSENHTMHGFRIHSDLIMDGILRVGIRGIGIRGLGMTGIGVAYTGIRGTGMIGTGDLIRIIMDTIIIITHTMAGGAIIIMTGENILHMLVFLCVVQHDAHLQHLLIMEAEMVPLMTPGVLLI